MEGAVYHEERRLVPQWSPELVALSYCISWLGAYTSTQIIIHAKYTRRTAIKWLWTCLASVAFGFSAIWSMHFVGMLACRLDVKIIFNIPLTIFSALIAVIFTFAALSSAYVSDSIESSKFALTLARWGQSIKTKTSKCLFSKRQRDLEADGYIPVSSSSDAGGDVVPRIDTVNDVAEQGDRDEDEHEENIGHLPRGRSPSPSFTIEALEHDRIQMPVLGSRSTSPVLNSHFQDCPRTPPLLRNSISFPYAPASPSLHRPPPQPLPPSVINNNPNTPSDSLSTDESGSHSPSRSNSSDSQTVSLSGTTVSGAAWNESLHAGLSREARMRIKAQARDRPMPTFGWRYWLKTHYNTISFLVIIRAAAWALAIVFMHYAGMWSMVIPEGYISWNLGLVVLSYAVAFAVCFVACIAMVHMEVHFGRQVAFSTIAAAGCCSMHYTGMAAATFHTRAPPDPDAGYPAYLPFAIVGIALFVCVISNVVLAHAAITSRNRMAEMILTRRRLWRIMAEKEAAEQANELKQQFISVASHEIRTPLHAVNGYCELLSTTKLTEEQALYVTSIQQACHAINVIAGNVLDFSKLDRNNVELSARPVLVDLRTMVENLARITETKGMQPGVPGVDVIVSVTDDVPPSVYLDETYTFRILMNLLSNAQKFCDSGFICVQVSMGASDQVVIKVSDTGCGIPKSFRSALFQPFRQADTSLTRPRQGTGLGLSIVKHLLQRMNGTIDVESAEGEGTTFTIKLPISVPNQTPPANIKRSRPRKKIKVIYRHAKTAKLYLELFNQFGLSATLGDSQSSLSDLVKDTDLIWTDVETVHSSKGLRDFMTATDWQSNSPLFLVHSDAMELKTLEPSLSSAYGVVLVKRPIVIHGLLDVLDDPTPHQGQHIKPMSAKVRFALPNDHKSTSMAQEKENGIEVDHFPVPLSPLSPNIPHATGEPSGKGRVLLVEDNLVSQHIGRQFLKKLGYEVVTANDGQDAIEKVKTSSFTCCLMDCQMPILDGFASTARIRELENSGTISEYPAWITSLRNPSNYKIFKLL
ncbi:unnamed protein product [Somion occarium]|uniref:Histidine kinase n=1 Tax=Somion occarium TaxID=3059160 RepID=A0ABP1CEH2_9APHY